LIACDQSSRAGRTCHPVRRKCAGRSRRGRWRL